MPRTTLRSAGAGTSSAGADPRAPHEAAARVTRDIALVEESAERDDPRLLEAAVADIVKRGARVLRGARPSPLRALEQADEEAAAPSGGGGGSGCSSTVGFTGLDRGEHEQLWAMVHRKVHDASDGALFAQLAELLARHGVPLAPCVRALPSGGGAAEEGEAEVGAAEEGEAEDAGDAAGEGEAAAHQGGAAGSAGAAGRAAGGAAAPASGEAAAAVEALCSQLRASKPLAAQCAAALAALARVCGPLFDASPALVAAEGSSALASAMLYVGGALDREGDIPRIVALLEEAAPREALNAGRRPRSLLAARSSALPPLQPPAASSRLSLLAPRSRSRPAGARRAPLAARGDRDGGGAAAAAEEARGAGGEAAGVGAARSGGCCAVGAPTARSASGCAWRSRRLERGWPVPRRSPPRRSRARRRRGWRSGAAICSSPRRRRRQARRGTTSRLVRWCATALCSSWASCSRGVWSCGEGSCGLAEAVSIGDSLSRGGKLSAAAVQQLLAAVQDAGKVTPTEEGTLRHLADKYSLGREAAAALAEGIEASGRATTGKRAAGRSGAPATKKRR